MSNLEELSDNELRTKLLEYGYPVGPVTQTTRKILIKKLRNLMDNRGAAGSRHSMAARYSSDDTDDDTSTRIKKKKKAPVSNRRQTLANPMPPPMIIPPVSNATKNSSPAKKRMSTRNFSPARSDNSNSDGISSTDTRSKNDKMYTKSNKNSTKVLNDGLETGSDSDTIEESTAKTLQQPVIVTKFGGGTKTLFDMNQATPPSQIGIATSDRTVLQSPKPLDADWKSIRDSNLRSGLRDEKYSVNLPRSSLRDLDSTNKKDTYVRASEASTAASTKSDDILNNYETPYLSEFTRRLSVQASLNSPSSKSTSKGTKLRMTAFGATPELKETDTNGHYSTPVRSSYPTGMTYVTSSLDKTRDSKAYKTAASTQEESKNNQNMVSRMLVIVLALFFGVLAIVYLGLEGKPDTFPALPNDSDIPICDPLLTNQNKPGSNCVPENSVKDIGYLLKRLHPILMRRAVSAECDNSKESPHLTNNQIIQIFASSDSMDKTKVRENMNFAHLLIFKNPKWGMSLIEILDDSESRPVIDSMEKVYLARLEDKLGIIISEPELPLQCHIRKKIMSVFTTVLIVAFGFLVMIGCQKGVNLYFLHQKKAEKEVFNLVSEIISMLEQHHQNFTLSNPGSSQESYLAINHIRDNLIAPKDRRKLSKLWEKAVKFLDENESRIRREVQLVAGEEFQVWRWLPCNASVSGSPGSSPLKMSKVWQGSAFETMDGSVNSPACSPTPCLKIRHMFDPDGESEVDWETKVKDAILEKCGEGVNILHIKVDRGSREGCVYLKCLSQEDAGKSYKALHGSWFDGHLVTVKYLRLERYHERFPEAINFTTPLKPSNNQRLSMQGNFWTNLSEAN